MNEDLQTALRQLPKVQRLVDSSEATDLLNVYTRTRVVEAIRTQLDELRSSIRSNGAGGYHFSNEVFFRAVREVLETENVPNLRAVINATGVTIHTNLGRAPLAAEALDAVLEVARGYSNLEFDLESGKRGSRYVHVEALLCGLTGAQGAVVVNNNAAAVMLVLDTFARDGEVVVSRGELIEIGGSFRIPDVITRSGARLVEVGSTNKTRIADYEHAITDDTRLLMKVHPSNYRVIGFTEEVPREELVEAARRHNILAVEDLGSGTLVDMQTFGLPHEPTIQQAVKSGLDVVTFSGDKLLGGPQAGIIVGKKSAIDAMKKNPLIRALRIDKLSLAALEATLRLYRDNEVPAVPVLEQFAQDAQQLNAKAEELRAALDHLEGLDAKIGDDVSYTGGGSLPGQGQATKVLSVAVDGVSPDALLGSLRNGNPPVIARISEDRLVFDMRTLTNEDVKTIAEALTRAVS